MLANLAEAISLANANRPFQVPKTPSTILPHAQRKLSIVAMRVCNEDRPGCGDYQRVGS